MSGGCVALHKLVRRSDQHTLLKGKQLAGSQLVWWLGCGMCVELHSARAYCRDVAITGAHACHGFYFGNDMLVPGLSCCFASAFQCLQPPDLQDRLYTRRCCEALVATHGVYTSGHFDLY
jgi:hypothetical protein